MSSRPSGRLRKQARARQSRTPSRKRYAAAWVPARAPCGLRPRVAWRGRQQSWKPVPDRQTSQIACHKTSRMNLYETGMPEISDVPIIPRRHLFENAAYLNPRLSPDGRWLSWVAAVDGVMNVWIAPRDDLAQARPLTRQTERPILEHS